jgi:hypothetical protein
MLIAACGTAACGAFAQTNGWQVNSNHCLFWNGQPYLPVGVRIPGDPDRIKAAAAAGIKDVIVELPANGKGWGDAFHALDAAGMRYIIALTSMPPMAHGFAVEPQSYRITGITEHQTLTVPIHNAASVLAVLANRRSAEVISNQLVAADPESVTVTVDPTEGVEHTLLLYPEMEGAELPDYWDSFDAYRDRLLSAFRENPPGKGLRGLLNPLGATSNLTTSNVSFLPGSEMFRLELESYLRQKYRSLRTAQKSWELNTIEEDGETGDGQGWAILARLVPLWSGKRGVAMFYDPKLNILRAADTGSTAWADIHDVITRAEQSRQSKLLHSLREVTGAPILQEWSGWAALYEGSSPSVDGIGIVTSGKSGDDWSQSSCRAISSASRCSRPTWTPASDIDVPSEDDGAAMERLAEMGARGWFFRSPGPETDRLVAALTVPSFVSPTDFPQVLFYPESATDPASPQHLPGGTWWLPSPASGNLVDLGSGFHAYRYDDGTRSYYVLWRDGQSQRFDMRIQEPKSLAVRSLDGLDPNLKITKTGVQFNASQTPLVITGTEDIPVPTVCIADTLSRLAPLVSAVSERTADGRGEQVIFEENFRALEKNPGAAFLKLREQYRKLSKLVSNYIWEEAEDFDDSNFSETSQIAGCSNGQALGLHAVFPAKTYFASYTVPVRTAKQQDLWIAAKIPPGAISSITAKVGGQVLTIQQGPVCPYGLGFAWYKLGTTRIASGADTIRIDVDGPPDGSHIYLDVILLDPDPFTPTGAFPPEIGSAAPASKPQSKPRRRLF